MVAAAMSARRMLYRSTLAITTDFPSVAIFLTGHPGALVFDFGVQILLDIDVFAEQRHGCRTTAIAAL
jgi:hypothetical protein